MTRQEFVNSSFSREVKGKVNGKWYKIVCCDFDNYAITIQEVIETVIPCIAIEELESPNA